MINTYIKSKSWVAMKAFLMTEHDGQLYPTQNYQNLIPPRQGIPSSPAYTDPDLGNIPSTPAKGDPEYWYTCIRSDSSLDLPVDIIECSIEEAKEVVGVWA